MDTLITRYGGAALITGASSGIGKAFAEELAPLGFNLVLNARRGQLLEELKETLESNHGISVIIVEKDLTESDAADFIFNTVQENNMEIGLLINNAGFGGHGTFTSKEINHELRMIDLNCKAPIALTYKFLPDMKKRKKSGLIFVSSVLGKIPAPLMSTYAATKAFEYSFANSLHGELKSDGIDVLALLPGTTETEFFSANDIGRSVSFPSATPNEVAITGLRSIGKKPYVIHGMFNKLGINLSQVVPKRWLTQINHKFMRDKYK